MVGTSQTMTMLKPASGRLVCKQRWPLQSLPSSLTLPLGLQLEQYALSQTSKDLCCQNADHVWSIRCPEDCQCKPRPSQPAQINNCNLKKTEDQCRKTGQHFVAPVCLPLCDLATVAIFFRIFSLLVLICNVGLCSVAATAACVSFEGFRIYHVSISAQGICRHRTLGF